MKIENINQDVTQLAGSAFEPISILHGVNCQRVMGSGAAKSLFTKWPHVRSQYMSLEKRQMELGLIQFVAVEDSTYVVNCFTQEFYGRDGKRYASVDAIVQCIKKVLGYKTEVYMVRIGSDLGGLDWDTEVEPAIESIDSEKVMHVCTLPV